MNRISYEIRKREYTMDIFREYTEQEQRDWADMWLFNDIMCAIRKQHNMEV